MGRYNGSGDAANEISRLIFEREHQGCERQLKQVLTLDGWRSVEAWWNSTNNTWCTKHTNQTPAPQATTPSGPRAKTACFNPTSARERKARKAAAAKAAQRTKQRGNKKSS